MRAFLWGRKMPLPSVEQFIGTNVTEQGFKDAQKQLVEYVGNEVPKKIDTDAAFATKADKATTLAGYGIADTYTKSQVDASITAVSGGHKAYQTLALAQAAQGTFVANTIVEVTNDPTASNNGTYQWNGTTLTKSAYDPLTQAKADATTKANTAEANAKTYADSFVGEIKTKTDKLASNNTNNSIWSVDDRVGQSALRVDEDGTTHAIKLSADEFGGELGVVKEKVDTTLLSTLAGYDWSVIDKFGKVPIGVKEDGTTSIASLESEVAELDVLNGVKVKYTNAKERKIPVLDTEIAIAISYGQSLSIGGGSYTAQNTTARYDNLMFDTGIVYSSTTAAISLVPAVSSSVYANLAETPAMQAGTTIRSLLEQENKLNPSEYSYQLALAATGEGGKAVNDLKKGTLLYNRNLTVVQKFKELGNAQGKVVKMLGWFWTQGEQDYEVNTTKIQYKDRLSVLIDDTNLDTKAITGQTENLKCIGYQTRTFAPKSLNPVIAIAQLELSNERDDYFIACPMYHLNGVNPTINVHPLTGGYVVMGAYYGLVYKRVVIDGEKWKPVQPLKLDVYNGSISFVKFHVPVGNLTFDTNHVPAYPNMGFNYFKPDGTEYTITNIKVINIDTIKITTVEVVVSGSTLKYAHGAGGNLRDEQGDHLSVYATGLNYPLHNWCVISEIKTV